MTMERTDSALQFLTGYGADDDDNDDMNESYNKGTSEGVDNISGSDDEGSGVIKVPPKRPAPPATEEFKPPEKVMTKEGKCSS